MSASDLAMSLFLVRASNRPQRELLREARPTPDPTQPRLGRISDVGLTLMLAEAYPAPPRAPRSTSPTPRKDFA